MSKRTNNCTEGTVLVLSMVFLIVFSALAVSMAERTSTNITVADNQKKVNIAYAAAQSGLECGKYIASTTPTMETNINYVTDEQADTVWVSLCGNMQPQRIDGKSVSSASRFTDNGRSGDQISTPEFNMDSSGATFNVRFYRYDDAPTVVYLESTGKVDNIQRRVRVSLSVMKDSKIMNYAIASRGRMIITGDTTIDGSLYSSWFKHNWHPGFVTTSETVVNGTLNTVISAIDLANYGNQMETLDANGDPIYDEHGNKVIGPYDQIQGYTEGVNYGVPEEDIPGMDEEDYDTSIYKAYCTFLPKSGVTVREYFPHQPGNYTAPKYNAATRLYRNIYQNMTIKNRYIVAGTNALFEKCTFEGVFYIESNDNASATSKCNNVRFNDCTFNGVIVTNVPKNSFIQWRHNCLYFTGGSHFNNNFMTEATILAPNFNVNLGNTNELETEGASFLTGAIVGGIVDIRGNAVIKGTIVSMYDTFAHSDGYVTNIGFAEDGGGEGGVPGDIGTIHIAPSESQLIPSGITTPIIIQPQSATYSEG